MAPDPSEISAGGIVAHRSGKDWQICLVKVHERWEIPKGHPDKGETSEQTALREISEETGLDLASLRIVEALTPSNYVYRSKDRLVFKRVDTFLVIHEGDIQLHPQESEIDDAGWFSLDQARDIAAFKDTKKLVDEARARLDALT